MLFHFFSSSSYVQKRFVLYLIRMKVEPEKLQMADAAGDLLSAAAARGPV